MERSSEKTRHAVLWECDHMRLVVRETHPLEGHQDWVHLLEDGTTGSLCEAGVYRVQAIVGGEHTIGNLWTGER